MNPFLKPLQYLINSICDSPTRKGEGNHARAIYFTSGRPRASVTVLITHDSRRGVAFQRAPHL